MARASNTELVNTSSGRVRDREQSAGGHWARLEVLAERERLAQLGLAPICVRLRSAAGRGVFGAHRDCLPLGVLLAPKNELLKKRYSSL